MREGVSLRGKVDILADKDVDQAYAIAKSIKHPWYRCQALAKVAEYSSDTFSKNILQESFDSAMMCHDENRRVSVACWPLGVSLRLGKRDLTQRFLDECMRQLNMDNDPISRWCATQVLYAIKTDTAFLMHFFHTFQKATSQGHGWRVEKSIKYLLNDSDIDKDQRYIDYLHQRQAGIEKWKTAHKAKN
ncbi:MAG: hypothetical protein GC149_13400 [Gammaproteobacteria bacterium]|nr:hypothetical protein [Gammaproteobacteria bacterium]